MRINNPKSFAGFGGSNEDSLKNSYNLVTEQQLSNLKDSVENNLRLRLMGDGKSGGFSSDILGSYGYAYLDSNGKIPNRFLPSIAITDVISIKQSVLKGQAAATAGDNDFESLINEQFQSWLVNTEIGGSYLAKLKQGDIIVITPDTVLPESTATIDESTAATSDIYTFDSRYCGAWIVVQNINMDAHDQENNPTVEANQLRIVKISYESGNIVSINNQNPGSTGYLELKLEHIIKQNNQYTPENIAEALIRLRNAENGRIAFWPNNAAFDPNTDVTSENTFAFVKDVEDEAAARIENDTDILNQLRIASGLLSTYCGDLRDDVNTLSTNIGERDDENTYDVDGTIFSQLKGLRNQVNTNASALFATNSNAQYELTLLNSKLTDLRDTLYSTEYRGVYELVENTVNCDSMSTTVESLESRVQFTKLQNNDIIYKDGNVIYTQEIPVETIGDDDRILAVYIDENEIVVDIKKVVDNGKVTKNIITIVLDHLVTKDGTAWASTPSLAGKVLSVLIAKKIHLNPIAAQNNFFPAANGNGKYTYKPKRAEDGQLNGFNE